MRSSRAFSQGRSSGAWSWAMATGEHTWSAIAECAVPRSANAMRAEGVLSPSPCPSCDSASSRGSSGDAATRRTPILPCPSSKLQQNRQPAIRPSPRRIGQGMRFVMKVGQGIGEGGTVKHLLNRVRIGSGVVVAAVLLLGCASKATTSTKGSGGGATAGTAATGAATGTGASTGNGMSQIMGMVGGKTYNMVGAAYSIDKSDDPVHTVLIYVFDQPVGCDQITTAGWVTKVA